MVGCRKGSPLAPGDGPFDNARTPIVHKCRESRVELLYFIERCDRSEPLVPFGIGVWRVPPPSQVSSARLVLDSDGHLAGLGWNLARESSGAEREIDNESREVVRCVCVWGRPPGGLAVNPRYRLSSGGEATHANDERRCSGDGLRTGDVAILYRPGNLEWL